MTITTERITLDDHHGGTKAVKDPDGIPRHPVWGGPFVLPPNALRSFGDHECGTCGRMVEPVVGKRGHPLKSKPKGHCKCEYYKRVTNWIDVMQDEFLLKQWGKRNVAWGMAQRPDLILAASTCRSPNDPEFSDADRKELNRIQTEAGKYAGDHWKADIGTSLHKLTHKMDRGDELGHVPERWRADLDAYWELTKDIKWHFVESFRVLDPLKVGGTVDRIGWYDGRFVVMDVKTGKDWNQMGFAMQLAMYAHAVPYDIATDARYSDPEPVDTAIGWVIKLPEGQGKATLQPVHIGMGWGACQVAKKIWHARDQRYFLEPHQIVKSRTLLDMAQSAGSVTECKLLWKNGKAMGHLTNEVQDALKARVVELGGTLK